MAKRTNMFASHEQVGIKEDLSDMIYNIDPTETPVVTAIGTDGEGGGNVLFDWQIDSLDTPDKDNAKIEGEDASAAELSATTRLQNIMQISDKVYGVTGTARVQDGAGRNDELDYQRLKKGVALRKDIEAVLTGQHTAKQTGGDAQARLTANFGAWIASNCTTGATGSAPAGDGSDTVTAGTPAAITEAKMKTSIQNAWVLGARPTMAFMPAAIKTTCNGFVGRADNVRGIDSEATVFSNVDVFVTEFGTVEFIPCRDIEANTVLGLDPEFCSVKYLRSFMTYDLAKMGDSEREQMIVEYGLKMNNEAAHFMIAGATG